MTGRSLREAALAYADAGWFVLPIHSGTKHPGSVVGLGWQRLSSRDPEQIAQWWDEDPDRGIALHVGRSGAVAFDLDNARLHALPVAIAQGLRSGRVQLSRRDNPDRGHYVFAAEPGAFGNGAGAFRPFGEVRGRGGVIIAAPTPHVKDDGEYRWQEPGPLPPLPEALRACLSKVTANDAEPLTDEQFEAFLANPTHQRSERPGALIGVLAKFEKDVRSGGSSHEALIATLPWAFREVRVGLYPAEEAVRRIESAFLDSFMWEGRSADGRTRPTGDEFYRAATWAAAQAMQADPAEILARANRNSPTAPMANEEAFWTARPELGQLRQFARSRRVGPWAVIGCVLARALATVPPSVVLPPLRGSHSSLNFFAAIVAPSGKGKGTAEAAAEDALITNPDVYAATLGSGEGIPKEFAYKKRAEQVDVRNSVLYSAPEIDSLAALKGRSGSTLLPELRKAFSGERLGFGYAAEDKKFTLHKHRYRMTMTVGVQPGRSVTLFEDADGGTPQRFAFFPTTDPDPPARAPAEPEPVKLPRWPSGLLVTDGRTLIGERDAEGAATIQIEPGDLRLSVPAQRDNFQVLDVPQSVIDEVDAEALSNLRGDRGEDLDSHGLFLRMKIAAGLMWLNGRTDAITEEDWHLAGMVKAVSDRTRAETMKVLRQQAAAASQSRGRAEGEREIAKAEVVEDRRLKRAIDNVRRHVEGAGRLTRKELRNRLKNDLREHLDEAVDRLVAAGVVGREDGDQGGYVVVFKAVR